MSTTDKVFTVEETQSDVSKDGERDMGKYPSCPCYVAADPYKGCAHDCAYCISTHNSADESRVIGAKVDFPEVLRKKIRALPRAAYGMPVYLSPWTDAYQPAEERLGITRRTIEMLIQEKRPFFVITKSDLVTRDLDLMSAEGVECNVCMSIVSADDDIRKMLEPGASPVESRFAALREVSDAQVRTVLKIDPVIPGITNTADNMRRIIESAAESNVDHITAEILRLTPDLWAYMQKVLPAAEIEKIRTAYFGEDGSPINQVRGDLYIENEERIRFLNMVRTMAKDRGMTFSTCSYRGSMVRNDTMCLGVSFGTRKQ
ncbi:MAG: radical SAM domain-containing protein [Candidatus Peregrinibacteria bacterium GW2011_GWF2_38_29]|nr:MAG: radical SAM domain-containing protein [Candidatus Peregrinibacteria bacterium GW2011_GWF2_38_29]HBB02635.1 hypothetical protein [Candidatus Peregrinibacteria bacterium]